METVLILSNRTPGARAFAFVRRLRLHMDATDKLCARADGAVLANDVNGAQEIYRVLSRRRPDTWHHFLLGGLAAYWQHDTARAMDVLEAGIRRFPSALLLVENFLRIGVESGQVDRILRGVAPQAGRAACERLFAQSPDWNTQVGLVAYCVQAGDSELANARIEKIIEACNNPATLWRFSDILLTFGRKNDADRIYQKLSGHVAEDPHAALYCALSFERLHDTAQAMDVLEAEIRRFPSALLLVENFLRIGVDNWQVDRVLRGVAPQAGRAACERLFAQSPNWNTQVGLVAYCVQAGDWELANARIEEIIEACNNPAALWRLSDILLTFGRKNEANRIYQKLSGHMAEDPDAALYCALSFERLLSPKKAADQLESELAKYPNSDHHLREHFFRILFETGQIERIASFIDVRASGLEAIEALFERFVNRSYQLKIVEYCVEKGHMSLVKHKLSRGPDEDPDESAPLWSIAQRMEAKGFAAEAREIYQALVNRPPTNSSSAYFGAASALSLGDVDRCLMLLEGGQRAYPAAVELYNLYLQVCAPNLKYERYSAFMKGLGSQNSRDIGSVAEFYRAALELDGRSGVEAFTINYMEIHRICPPESFAAIKNDVLGALRKTTPLRQRDRLLAFLGPFLGLDAEFVSALWAVLCDRAHEQFEEGVAPEAERRAIEMLFRLTPPMIPSEREQSEGQVVRQFIDACHSLALRPIELDEPIRDMANNWTPWQYLFCSGAIHAYSAAIAAFESIAFKTWPKLNYTARHVSDGSPRRPSSRRIRIGFLVHDAMPMMSGLLKGLDPCAFETVFLRPGKMGQTLASQNWILRAERVVEFSDQNTYAAIDTIAAEQLDIIVSGPAVAAIFFPMMARLAHLQMVVLEPNWTDGLTNADYYISWMPAEPAKPRDFYRTKVALLPHPPYYIEQHRVDEISDLSRAEVRQRLLGCGENDRVYLCANTPPKIHPDMDELFGRLLVSDPRGTLVILRGEYPPARTLKFRLHRKLGQLMDRVVFLPTLKQEDAHRLLLSADACLDSFPLCGMSSSFDAAMLGVPIVTLPSMIPFGKWTATIYDYIGVSGLTAKDQDEYLQIALRLANDPVWRNKLGDELRQKAKLFIESEASVSGFSGFINHAWERHLSGLPPVDWIDDGWQM